MARLSTLILSALFIFQAHADLSTAFLVARIDIEDSIRQIDADAEVSSSLAALEHSLQLLLNYQDEVFAPALEQLKNEKPLTGLMLTRIHSYLKIHLTILERGLALSAAQSQVRSSIIDENAIALMTISLLKHSSVYLKHDRLRLLLNQEDSAYQIKTQALRKAYQLFINDENYDDLVQASARRQLRASVNQQFLATLNMWDEVERAFSGDWWNQVMTFVVHHISGGIGNAAGSVRFRKGTMWQDEQLASSIEAKLLPMDIITERTPFILTDRFIPGHFGHNAFWIGTEDQLRALGIWNQPYLRPYHQAIREGYNIFETDRSGTHLKRLSDFMNVDEFAIVRREDRPRDIAGINEFYAVLFAQYGKTYDFNFDVETTDKLVCSELIYQAFGDVVWTTEPYLGRFTISPDNVASIIVEKDTPFKLIYAHERTTDGVDNFKTLVELASDLGFTYSGVDGSGQAVLEKGQQTCMNLVNERGQVNRACGKTWLRPVYGKMTERRWQVSNPR